MALVHQAFELIQDSLEDHELEGFYLFNIARCGIKFSKEQLDSHKKISSPGKAIDLYDLMDVELRMIRQKNLEIDNNTSYFPTEKIVTVHEENLQTTED